MVKRKEIFHHPREIDELTSSINEWVWNSHYWIESVPGYYKCEWCKQYWGSNMLCEDNIRLCPENPRLKILIEKIEHNNIRSTY